MELESSRTVLKTSSCAIEDLAIFMEKVIYKQIKYFSISTRELFNGMGELSDRELSSYTCTSMEKH